MLIATWASIKVPNWPLSLTYLIQSSPFINLIKQIIDFLGIVCIEASLDDLIKPSLPDLTLQKIILIQFPSPCGLCDQIACEGTTINS